MGNRISIYIDGANFYYGLKTINQKYSDLFFDFQKFIKKIISQDELISIKYYNASLKENLNKHLYWMQMKFFNRLRKIPKCEVILCKRQKRFNQNDEEYYTIKGDDINLALDMLNDAWEDKYDKAILISGDGDFAPLLSFVKKKNKRIQVITFEEIVSKNLINESNSFLFLNKKLINKFFYRN